MSANRRQRRTHLDKFKTETQNMSFYPDCYNNNRPFYSFFTEFYTCTAVLT